MARSFADPKPASGERRMAEYRAQQMPRFRLVRDGLYLHFSGELFTEVKAHAWFGSSTQLSAMRRASPLALQCEVRAVE